MKYLLILGIAAAWIFGTSSANALAVRQAPEFLHRVKRIIGKTSPVTDKNDARFRHIVTLTGKYTDYKVKKVFSFVKIKVPYFRRVHCGASLLDENHVVTAAHCLYNSEGEYVASNSWRIYIHGTKRMPSLTDRFKAWMAKKFKVVGFRRPRNLPYHTHALKYFVHPQYDKLRFNNDIAIIRVRRIDLADVPDAGKIRLPPANIIGQNGPLPGEKCWYAGWGCTKAKGNVEETLLKAEFSIKDLKVCVNTYSGASMEEWSKYLCAQAPQTAICAGDSGGGLTCESKATGEVYLAGIASSGAAGNTPELFPSNFMNIALYTDWINAMKQSL